MQLSAAEIKFPLLKTKIRAPYKLINILQWKIVKNPLRSCQFRLKAREKQVRTAADDKQAFHGVKLMHDLAKE